MGPARLGFAFLKVLVTNFAQKFNDFLSNFENMKLKVKSDVDTFWQLSEKFGLLLFQHLVTLLAGA